MKTFYNKEAPTLVVTDVSLGQSRGYTCARKVGSEESSSICKPKLKWFERRYGQTEKGGISGRLGLWEISSLPEWVTIISTCDRL